MYICILLRLSVTMYASGHHFSSHSDRFTGNIHLSCHTNGIENTVLSLMSFIDASDSDQFF